MYVQLERYTADRLLAPAAQTTVLRQSVDRTAVHWHDYYELVYVIAGCAEHIANGVPHRIGPATLFLLTPADFHQILPSPDAPSTDPLTCYNVVIDASALEGQQLQDLLPLVPDGGVRTVADYPEAEADFARLWAESQERGADNTLMVQALLRCILIEFARRCAPIPVPPSARAYRSDTGIARAVRYVDHHFREPLTLADVAAQAHLSPNYFSERFREFTGTSFQAYLQHRRLCFARSLLASTDVGVTEACHAAGFNSVSHFGRAYRRRYGQPPSAYRAATITGVSSSNGPLALSAS